MMNRRQFLATSAAALAPLDAAIAGNIIDTHTHFYDPSRPQGVPWPAKGDPVLYRTVLPGEFRRLTKPYGIKGTIEVEASPLIEDNQWVLDLAAKDKILVGTVGHLQPGKPDFPKHLERFHKNRLFLGIRLGHLWGPSGREDLPEREFVAHVKMLSDAGLEVDMIGGPHLMTDVVRLSDAVPDLRIVINHLPADRPKESADKAAFETALQEIAHRPLIYAKVSGVLRKVDGRVPADVAYYKPALDELWEIFGADRVVYGSNWPVSDKLAPYGAAFQVVREYFTAKGQDAAEKYFWKNSQKAYRWVAR
ncbi:MAG: amidohydrolase family protein [Bryobacterales bacterium]|nr:amidohydrolase family protein [Bryobacterales bacterium]